MKKSFLTLLVLPLLLISCAKKGDDGRLQGTWQAQVKSSDLDLLSGLGEAANTNPAATTETLIYKFDEGSIQTYRSKDYDYSANAVEKEIGSYKAEDNTLKISIQAHSCVDAEGEHPRKLERTIPYTVSNDFKTVTLNFGVNKKVVFTKIQGIEEDAIDNSLNSADVGCFVKGNNGKPGFEKGKVKKPKKAGLDIENAENPDAEEETIEE